MSVFVCEYLSLRECLRIQVSVIFSRSLSMIVNLCEWMSVLIVCVSMQNLCDCAYLLTENKVLFSKKVQVILRSNRIRINSFEYARFYQNTKIMRASYEVIESILGLVSQMNNTLYTLRFNFRVQKIILLAQRVRVNCNEVDSRIQIQCLKIGWREFPFFGVEP